MSHADHSPDALTAPSLPRPLVDAAVVQLVAGRSREQVAEHLASLGQPPALADAIVTEARAEITRWSEHSRDEYLGKQIQRLEQLYAAATTANEVTAAVAAVRELNRLLNLYNAPPPLAVADAAATEAQRELTTIADYIAPLELIDADYPLVEHVRIAADLIRRHQLACQPPPAAPVEPGPPAAKTRRRRPKTA